MPSPLPIINLAMLAAVVAAAEATSLLPDKAVLLVYYAIFGGLCGLARAANASGAIRPSLWLACSMMIVGMALGGIAGGVCMWKAGDGAGDGAFYSSFAISGLCGLLGPAVATKILTRLGTKGIAP